MTARIALIAWFSLVLIAMLAVTGWASSVQPLWHWTGPIAAPDHAWTIATLADAYFGFIAFYVWVAYKERRPVLRALWFAAVMLLGNLAMAVYMLKELRRLAAHESFATLLTRRNG